MNEKNRSPEPSDEQREAQLQRGMIDALDARLRALVTIHTKPTRRNIQMSELTGVPASQWSSWWAGRARPSCELLIHTCKIWPEYALWLMTGVADELGGQIGVDTIARDRQEPAIKLLRWIAMQSAAHQEAGGKWGVSLNEWESDETNALLTVRANELRRRLARNNDGNQQN